MLSDDAMADVLTAAGWHAAAATGLAVAVWAVTRLWRNPHAGRPLWGAVVLKLLCPPLLAVAVWAPAFDTNRARQEAAPSASEPPPSAADSDPPTNRDREGAARATPVPQNAAAPVSPESRDRQGAHSTPERSPAAEFRSPPRQPRPAVVPRRSTRPERSRATSLPHGRGSVNKFSPVTALLAAWAAGTLLIWSLAAVRAWRFGRRVNRLPDAGPDYQERLAAAAGSLGIAPPRLKLSATVGPLAWAHPVRFGSLNRPAVVVPEALLSDLPPDAAEALLAHECAHLARRDELWRCLELLACGLWWWLPTAWLAASAGRRCEELCCDAAVLNARRSAADPAGPYAAALLAAAEFSHLRSPRPAPLPASGAGRPAFLKQRFTMICQNRVPARPGRRLRWPLAAAALALAAVGVTAAQEEPAAAEPAADVTLPRGTLREVPLPGGRAAGADAEDRMVAAPTVTRDGRLLVRARAAGETRVTYRDDAGREGAFRVTVTPDETDPGRTLADVTTAFNADAAAVEAAGGPVSADEILYRLRRDGAPPADGTAESESHSNALRAFLAGEADAVRPLTLTADRGVIPAAVRFRYAVPRPDGRPEFHDLHVRDGGAAIPLRFRRALAKVRESDRPAGPTLAEAVAEFNARFAPAAAGGDPVTAAEVRAALRRDLADPAVRGTFGRDDEWAYAVEKYLDGVAGALNDFELSPTGPDRRGVRVSYFGPSLEHPHDSVVRQGGPDPADEEASPPDADGPAGENGAADAPAADAAAGSVPLAEAVAAFNADKREEITAGGRPPLSAEEVVAALEGRLAEAGGDGFGPHRDPAAARRVIETRTLPPGARFLTTKMYGDPRPVAWGVSLSLPNAGGRPASWTIREMEPSDAIVPWSPPVYAALGETASPDLGGVPLVEAVERFNAALGGLDLDERSLTPGEATAALRSRVDAYPAGEEYRARAAALAPAFDGGGLPPGAKLHLNQEATAGGVERQILLTVPNAAKDGFLPHVLRRTPLAEPDGAEPGAAAAGAGGRGEGDEEEPAGPTLAEAVATFNANFVTGGGQAVERPLTEEELRAAMERSVRPREGNRGGRVAEVADYPELVEAVRTALATGRMPPNGQLSLYIEKLDGGGERVDIGLSLPLGLMNFPLPVRVGGVTWAVRDRIAATLAAAAGDEALPVETRLKLLRESVEPGELTAEQTAWLFEAFAETATALAAAESPGRRTSQAEMRLGPQVGAILATMATLGVAAPDAAAARGLADFAVKDTTRLVGDADASAGKILRTTAATAAGLRTLLDAAALPGPAPQAANEEYRRETSADWHRRETEALLDAVRAARPATDEAARVLLNAAGSDDPAVRAAAVEALAGAGG